MVDIDVNNDASVEAGVAAADQAIGGIDVLVNCAGAGAHSFQETCSGEDFRRVFDVNVFGIHRASLSSR